MWLTLAVATDFLHALLMAAWILALPLLFWHRWPRLSRAYGIYAIAFVVVSQVSHVVLGECFLTTVSRAFWEKSGGALPSMGEWFTVRIAEAVFRMSPSHRSVVLVSEALILATAAGVIVSLRKLRRGVEPTRAQPLDKPA